MKRTPSPSDSHWENLVRRARHDVGPSVDLAALKRVVREAATAEPLSDGWFGEFFELSISARVLSGCVTIAGLCGAAASWEAWTAWQTLPWAQFLGSTTGGAL
jgi:membrane-associated protease RseP (regulator of RpoE activity)